MADEVLRRDVNAITLLGGITNTAGQEIVQLRVDSITKRLLVDSAVTGGNAAGTTPTIYNVTMTTANFEYSQALPAGTKGFTFQCQGAYDVRFAFVTGKVATPTAPYMTLKNGQNYYENNLSLTSITIYLACATAAQVTEVVCWV